MFVGKPKLRFVSPLRKPRGWGCGSFPHRCTTGHDITPIARAADTLNISFDGSQQ